MLDCAAILTTGSPHRYPHKNPISLTTGRTQSCVFSPTLGRIYPLKESEIEKSRSICWKKLSIWLSIYPKTKALSRINFRWKIQLLFAVFGVFRVKMDPKRKDQEARGQVSTSFPEALNWGLTFSKKVRLQLISNWMYFSFSVVFLSLDPLFRLWARF